MDEAVDVVVEDLVEVDVVVGVVEVVLILVEVLVLVEVAKGPLLQVFDIGAQVLACQLLQMDW